MTDEQALREQARRAVHAAIGPSGAPAELGTTHRKAQRVLDSQLALRPRASRPEVACRKGCAMCCHLRVMATPAEVLGLVHYMQQQLGAEAMDAAAARIAFAAAQLRLLPRERLLLTNVACPVLVDGACGAYAARPLNCRAYHSLDYDACLASFLEPADTSLTHPHSAPDARVHEGVQLGLIEVLRSAGVDSRQYELVTAMDEALRDLQASERFARGETVFRTALQL